jgi:hypothetical protein
VVVVNVLRIGPMTNRTESVLRFAHCLDVNQSDPIPPSKVVLPAAPVQPLSTLASRVVAILAVRSTAGLRALVATEVLVRLDRVAVRTPLVSGRDIARLVHGLSDLSLPLSVAGATTGAEGIFAVLRSPVGLALVETERCECLELPIIGTEFHVRQSG